MMNKIGLLVLLWLVSSVSLAGNHGPCKIIEVSQSNSYANNLLIKMACTGTSLPDCVGDNLQNVVAFDATTAVGKFRSSMVLAAFASGKDVRVSTYGACLSDIQTVPSVYGIVVY